MYQQPFKATYILLRLSALFFLVPSWALYYTLFRRPRQSWTLKETINVRLVRWLMPINAACGTSPLKLDKTRSVPQDQLKETSFTWVEPVDRSLVRDFADDENVRPVRVPAYVWPKGGDLQLSGEGIVGLWFHGGGYMMGNASESFDESGLCCFLVRDVVFSTLTHF
jgi:hypothetical protein